MKRGDTVSVRDTPSIVGTVLDLYWIGQWWPRWVFPRIWRIARVLHSSSSSHYTGESIEWAAKFLRVIPPC